VRGENQCLRGEFDLCGANISACGASLTRAGRKSVLAGQVSPVRGEIQCLRGVFDHFPGFISCSRATFPTSCTCFILSRVVGMVNHDAGSTDFAPGRLKFVQEGVNLLQESFGTRWI